MSHDTTANAYEALIEADADSRWAFGTDFDDPLAGLDVSVEGDVDAAALAAYCLMLGDDALITSHRLNEWSTLAPELEVEMLLPNVGLDLVGQVRLLYLRAAAADPAVVPALPEGSPIPADDALAFFRPAGLFRNARLCEVPHGDFAECMARLLVLSVWRLGLFEALRTSRDAVIAAVAAKGCKELAYHRDAAARWVVTLARGTDESRRRMVDGLAQVWPFVDELFADHAVESSLAEVGVGVAPSSTRGAFDAVLADVLGAAGLEVPQTKVVSPLAGRAGRDGIHTEALSRLLSEMQSVAREHPMGRW